jgi:hypothetical protein
MPITASAKACLIFIRTKSKYIRPMAWVILLEN